jgi:hypothetical protein
MKRNFETKFGTITLQNAMFDIDGTNLEEGVEIKLDGDLIGEAYGYFDFGDDDITIEEIEEYVVKNSDIDKL